MPYIIDIVVVLLAIILIVTGVRKGIIRSAIEFLGTIASVLVASWLGGMVSAWIFDTFFKQGLYDRVLKIAQGKTGPEAVTSLFEGLPEFVVRLLGMNGITESSVSHTVNSSAVDIAGGVTTALSPVFISIIKVFAVIILFVLCMLVVKGLASLISGIFRLPVLHQLNGLLGGIFGLLSCAVIVWVAFSLFTFLSPMLDAKGQKTVDDALDKSIVTKHIVALNPFDWIFQ